MNPCGFPEFVYIWNKLQGQTTPAIHLRMARWLETARVEERRRLLLMAFRGCGKSTVVGLFASWVLSQTPSVRIMVLAADLALARKMVRTVKRIVERHPLTKRLKPARADQWSAEQFTIQRPMELRDPSMLARGIDGNITGCRADLVICDDVEVPRTADTAPKREDMRAKLAEIDYILVPDGLTLYVGTPHSYYTLYASEARREIGESHPFLDGYDRLEIPVLTQDGESAWPERFPLDQIERVRRATGPTKFTSQMLLVPVNIAKGRLDAERIRPYDAELLYREANRVAVLSLDGVQLVSVSCWWDPAYGARAARGGDSAGEAGGGDASVVAAVFADGEGTYYLHRIRYLSADPSDAGTDEATQQCRQVAAFARDLHLPAITVETNGLGRFLPGLLRRELARARVACAVVEVTSRQPKHLRIVEAFDAVLAAGALKAHRSIWDTPFIREMRDWRPDARFKGRDDGLDAVAGCLKSEPVRLGRFPRPERGADWRGFQIG